MILVFFVKIFLRTQRSMQVLAMTFNIFNYCIRNGLTDLYYQVFKSGLLATTVIHSLIHPCKAHTQFWIKRKKKKTQLNCLAVLKSSSIKQFLFICFVITKSSQVGKFLLRSFPLEFVRPDLRFSPSHSPSRARSKPSGFIEGKM